MPQLVIPKPLAAAGLEIVLITTMMVRLGRWYVHRRILIKEAGRFEHETRISDRHYRPVFRPREMVNADGIPGNEVRILQRTITRSPLHQSIRRKVLVNIVTGGVAFSRIVCSDP